MDNYVQTIQSLENFDPQALESEILDQALKCLKHQLLKAEAARLLVAAKELPPSRVGLGRLSSLLTLVFRPEKQLEPKIIALRGLDSVSLIICGLCLTQKILESMRKELFDMLLEQVIVASQANVNAIVKNDEIHKIVLTSVRDDDFIRNHLSLRQTTTGPIWPSLQYSLAGNPSWCYSKVLKSGPDILFPKLVSKVLRSQITTFLPAEQSTDGLVRFVVPFDQLLLRTLFGCAESHAMDAERFSVSCAVKNQIANSFGTDVLDAVSSSHTWRNDTGEIETKCLRVDVFPGQILIISLIIGWMPCYHFVNSLYRS